MAVSAKWYGKAGLHIAKGEIAYLTDTVKVALLSSGYTFDQDVHETYADIAAQALGTANGYTARGNALSTKTLAYDAASNRTRYFAANSVWTPGAGQSLAAVAAVIYKDTGTDATSWLMGYVDFGATITAIGAPLTVNWDATDGVMYFQAV